MSDRVRELDARGLNCPLPVLRAKKVLRELDPGMRLRVLATDPAAQRDFPAFCETTGHRLVAQKEDGGVFAFLLEKGG